MATKDEFDAFERVRKSNCYDMKLQADDACWASNLAAGTYTDILLNQEHYRSLYAEQN